MLRRTATAMVFLGTVSPALATGGFNCTIDDKNLSFEAASALGHGMGAPIINLAATGLVKLKGAPADLAKLELSKALVHSWMLHPDLRLHFYAEREGAKPHGYVELVISAIASDDEGMAEGDYQLTLFFTEPPAPASEGTYLKAEGKISCFVE